MINQNIPNKEINLDISDFAKNSNLNAAFISAGCKLNQFESYQFQEILRLNNPNIQINIVEPKLSYLNQENQDSKINVFFLNTCSVTEKANTETNKIIRKIKRKYPESLLILTGCSVQLNACDYAGISNVRLIDNNIKTALLGSASKSSSGIYVNQKRVRPYLKIQEGCDIRCSFCIIPDARPSKWSMEKSNIVTALKRFEDNGFKEVILTGINIGSYDSDFAGTKKIGLDRGKGFKELLKKINKENINIKIRISSLDPIYLDDELIGILSEYKNIQNHFHIPLQSGSDRILNIMNRHYDFGYYANIIEKLVLKIKDVAIGTDIISGFPTETETDFERTVKNLNDLPLYYIHAFSYSDRKGAKASFITPKVNEKAVKERTKAIREISLKKKSAFIQRFENRALEFLTLPKGIALSSNYIKAKLMQDDHELAPGICFKGKITDINSDQPSVRFESFV